MIAIAGLIGYATSLVGLAAASVFSLYSNRFGLKFRGVLGGFTAGVLISFVCFGLLPQAFVDDGLFFGIAGIIAGACFTVLIESRIGKLTGMGEISARGAVMALGVAIHNIPEGIAFGAALGANPMVGLSMCLVIAPHCFTETIAVFEAVKKSGASYRRMLALCFLFAIPMGASCLLGAAIKSIPGALMSLCVSFAGGVIIYITCGEIIPESQKTWSGRLTALGAVAGFAVGIAFTIGMH